MRSAWRSEGGLTLAETSGSSAPTDDTHLDLLEQQFLETPTAEGLQGLYRALLDAGQDDRLAAILDKVRPIQHRVTLVHADSEPFTLEALARDPHVHVRRVVAAHARITEEVAFRLCEDQQPPVRLALRKNPRCHPFLSAAVTIDDGPPRDESLATADHMLEVAWQARRAGLSGEQLADLAEEWLGVDREGLVSITVEQVGLLLQVLSAKLGKGSMPRRPKVTPPSKGGSKKKKR
jgi:hypothetical protein